MRPVCCLQIYQKKPEESLSTVETFYQQIDLDFLAKAED